MRTKDFGGRGREVDRVNWSTQASIWWIPKARVEDLVSKLQMLNIHYTWLFFQAKPHTMCPSLSLCLSEAAFFLLFILTARSLARTKKTISFRMLWSDVCFFFSCSWCRGPCFPASVQPYWVFASCYRYGPCFPRSVQRFTCPFSPP